MGKTERLKQRWRTYKRDRWLRKCAKNRDRDAEILGLTISAYRRMGINPGQVDLETREMVERLVLEEYKMSKRKKCISARFWEGRTPPPEYFAPVDPYQDIEARNMAAGLPTINHQALGRHLKETGKRGHELSREEVSRFVNNNQPPCDIKSEKR